MHNDPTYVAKMVQRFFEDGEAQASKLVANIRETVIQDYLVAPSQMTFQRMENEQLGLMIPIPGRPVTLSIHSHALSQLCQKVEVPGAYVRKLLQREAKWATSLAAANLQVCYQNTPVPPNTKYLHRVVRGELRGFLSRRYNRDLASGPLLAKFMSVCQEVGARPVNARFNAVKNALMCAQPQAYDVGGSSPVLMGVEWANSDFGSGRHTISLAVWTTSGSKWVLQDALSQVHIGGIIKDSELEMSDQVHAAELEAQSLATRDVILQQLSPEGIERVLDGLRKAHEEQVGWAQIRSTLAGYLNTTQLGEAKNLFDEGVEYLPPTRNGNTSMAWALEVLGHFAKKQDSEERKTELEGAAGMVLGKYIQVKQAS
jgi:hypothetical protein